MALSAFEERKGFFGVVAIRRCAELALHVAFHRYAAAALFFGKNFRMAVAAFISFFVRCVRVFYGPYAGLFHAVDLGIQ